MTNTASEPRPLDVRVRCGTCGGMAARVQLVATGESGSEVWRFIYSGIEAGNGSGDEIAPEKAAAIAHAFTEPLTFERVRTAGLHDNAGLCAECQTAYCRDHWKTSSTGYGTCPRGHGASLDPHWWPDFDELDTRPPRPRAGDGPV